MLFQNQTQSIQESIDNIQSRIDELERLLIGLRSDKSSLEAEYQQVLTLESGAESAINQVQQFLISARSIGREDLIETFWGGLNSLSNPDRPMLTPETPQLDPVVEEVPVPEQTIEVEAEDAPEATEPTDHDDYDRMDFEQLKAEARKQKLSLRGRRSPDQVRNALRSLPKAA